MAAVFAASLLACSGAYAQTSGGVDQYVEDEPSAGGSGQPGKDKDQPVTPSVVAQIEDQGGSDAAALQEAAAAPTPKLNLPDAPTKGVRDGGLSNASPVEDVSAANLGDPDSNPLAGAETIRLVGFLVVLFGISVATLTAAALRQRRSHA